MEENDIKNELTDSIEFGSASKGSKKKVYGDILKAPIDFGKKVLIAKAAESLALGEINMEQYTKLVLEIKGDCR